MSSVVTEILAEKQPLTAGHAERLSEALRSVDAPMLTSDGNLLRALLDALENPVEVGQYEAILEWALDSRSLSSSIKSLLLCSAALSLATTDDAGVLAAGRRILAEAVPHTLAYSTPSLNVSSSYHEPTKAQVSGLSNRDLHTAEGSTTATTEGLPKRLFKLGEALQYAQRNMGQMNVAVRKQLVHLCNRGVPTPPVLAWHRPVVTAMVQILRTAFVIGPRDEAHALHAQLADALATTRCADLKLLVDSIDAAQPCMFGSLAGVSSSGVGVAMLPVSAVTAVAQKKREQKASRVPSSGTKVTIVTDSQVDSIESEPTTVNDVNPAAQEQDKGASAPQDQDGEPSGSQLQETDSSDNPPNDSSASQEDKATAAAATPTRTISFTVSQDSPAATLETFV